MAVDNIYDVASVSEPANTLSLINTTFIPSRVRGFNASAQLYEVPDFQ